MRNRFAYTESLIVLLISATAISSNKAYPEDDQADLAHIFVDLVNQGPVVINLLDFRQCQQLLYLSNLSGLA